MHYLPDAVFVLNRDWTINMKDINPNDDHSTLRRGVCAPSCNA
jgi:hypothetical protein